jgi:MoxR-like ATPase
MKLNDTFKGEGNEKMPNFQPLFEEKDYTSYVISDKLRRAVQVAILLGKPLLLTGEPGTGKTQLAGYIANQYLEKDETIEDRLFLFNTKTTSTATDLFYRYDSLQHFQYVQNHQETLDEKAIDEMFIKYQAFGKAIKSGKRCVVLIDEIDKAPRDLANDILDVMEELSFEVPEIGAVGNNRIKAKMEHRPIVILTSNTEKNLPDAFLRRCVFFHIEFPSPEKLKEILAARTFKTTGQNLDLALEHFEYVRQKVKQKKPSTAEFIAWMAILENMDFDFGQLKDLDKLKDVTKADLETSYSVLVKDKEDLKEL